MSATTRFTQDEVIGAIADSHGLKAVAARALGCTRQTIQNYCDRFPKVAESVEEAREAMKDDAESSLYTAITSGEAWAVCFYLKTQAKDRGYVERQEHSNPPGEEFRVAVEPKSWREAVQPFMPPEGPSDDSRSS